jgi:hypothetical protein
MMIESMCFAASTALAPFATPSVLTETLCGVEIDVGRGVALLTLLENRTLLGRDYSGASHLANTRPTASSTCARASHLS